MRRKILIGAAIFLGIILILAIAVFWYIRSGRLDAFLKDQIVSALSDYGIRAEIDSTQLDLRGYVVTLNGMTLYAGEDSRPFARVDEMTAKFSVVSYLWRNFNITSIDVTSPRITIEYDEQGRSNIEGLREPPTREKAETNKITFLTALITLKGGEFNYSDLRRKLAATLPNIEATFNPRTPDALEEKIDHVLTATFNGGTLNYQGEQAGNISSRVVANVTDQNATITQFETSSDLGRAVATGVIESFSPFKYATESLRLDARLEQVARVFAPDMQMSGNVTFTGKVEGTNGDYRARGSLSSDEIAAEGFRIEAVAVETDVSGSGPSYSATANLRAGGVSGRDVTIGSVRLTGAKIEGRESDFDLRARVALDQLRSGKVSVTGFSADLSADPLSLTLADLSAQTLGGTVTGRAQIAYTGEGSSTVDVAFNSVDLDQAAMLASEREADVRGTTSGTARLTFPGLDYQAATGRIQASFDASVSPLDSTVESQPAQGQVSLVATGRGFNIERAYIRSAASEITATGTAGWNGAVNLDVNFKSSDMAEVQRVVDAFGFIPEKVKRDYKFVLSGEGEFTGRVEGRVSAPSVRGHLRLENISRADDPDFPEHSARELIGSFEGDISYTPALLSIENGSLVKEDSRADFNITARLDRENAVSVQATVKNFNLPTIVQAAAPEFSDFVSGGAINGTIDLRGLPGPRTIEGTAQVTLSDGRFKRFGEGEQEETVSVPSFSGSVTIANSILSVQDLKMTLEANTEIVGEATFNLDTNAYSINAEGRNIDLAYLSNQLRGEEGDGVNLTGRADLTVTGQGRWGDVDDWSQVNLNATIQGKDVRLDGRDLGDAKIVAYTDNGLLKVEATANVLDQMRTLTATVDLRDRKSYPVSASVEFTDADIGPYLGLVAPELSGITGRATGSITLGGSLLNREGDFSADNVQAVARITRLQLGGELAEGQQYTITNQGDVVVTATPQRVIIEPVTFVGDGTSFSVEGTIAREAEANSAVRMNGEINLRLLSSFTTEVFATGIARVEATIVGSFASPQLLGVVSLREVGLRVVDFPLSVARGNGQIRFTSNQALLENFTATTPGGGTLSVQGGAALAGLAPDRWRLEIAGDQVGIEFPRDTQTTFDAQLVLQGNNRVQVLSGDIYVRRASYTQDITIEELLTSGGPFSPDFLDPRTGGGGGGAVGAGPPVALDLRVTADDTLIIKNNLADALGSAFLTIRGRIDEPVISGRVQLERGTLEFRSGRFELSRGIITLPGRRRAEPILDIQSEAEISGYRITVGFNGRLDRLETTLRSDPPLSEVDIVSLVLTGTVSGADETVGAAVTQTGLGLAQSLLSASLSEQIERRTQRLFGLSRFSIDPLLVGRGSDPTARITLGQRITKNLTVTYSQNLTSGTNGLDRVVLVEYRLSNRFSVVGYRNDRGEVGFDVRLRKRF
jgi:translocation and assembly module TamB